MYKRVDHVHGRTRTKAPVHMTMFVCSNYGFCFTADGFVVLISFLFLSVLRILSFVNYFFGCSCFFRFSFID